MNKALKKDFKLAIFVWLASALLATLVYLFVISPEINLEKQIAAQFVEKQKAFTTILNSNSKDARANLNQQMLQWQDEVGQYAIGIDDLPNLTFDISKIAKDVKVESFSISSQDVYSNIKKQEGAFVNEKQLKVNFKSDFNKFAAFLNAVERHRPVVVVNEFSISNTEHDPSSSQVSLILSVYVKKKQGS
ncbi:MAG: hypothetical protein ABFD79_18555 [Phycisphaerales bacterium]